MFILKKYVILLFSFASGLSLKAQLVINEVSQGSAGSQEYVELLVVGTPTCNAIPCMDLRGYYIDDNNGYHASGSGVGIAAGCVRFTNDAFWSCIPAGTLILIYNDADLNTSVPAADLSMSDGNCTLVIPISNCTLFERHTTQPSTTVSAYPTSGFTPCGSWTNISMANSDDSFQAVDPSGNTVFSVSWGNNTLATNIYFSGSQAGMVCSLTNAADNNPFNQSNWVSQAVSGNQTPGAPNNAANAAWINSMNNSCAPLLPLAVTSTVSNAGCTCSGSATVTPTGAIAPYTYAWAPSGGTAASASGLCAGNYSVTVTSSNGCTQTVTLTINSISTLSVTATPTNVTCNGGGNGAASASASGGSGSYTYTWSPSGGNTSTASSLTAGNYSVTVSDGAGCVLTTSLAITQPPALTVTATQTNVTCNGANNGNASVAASGGTGAYTYSWTPSGGTGATATGLAAGNYSVIVTDANTCTVSTSLTIAQPPALTVTPTQTNVTCNGATNGIASVTASGGTGAYSYSWTPSGGNAATASGLAAGNYSVTVADSNNCTVSVAFTITQPTALTIAPTQTNVACNGGSDGAASVSVSGGTGAYTYTWTPSGGNTVTAANLAAGNYSVTASDANSCTVTASFAITQPTALTVTPTQTNVTCNGGTNGAASVSVSGGTGAYTYTWAPSGGNTASATNLAAGNYSAMVADANGCLSVTPITITEPPILALALTQTNVACSGGATGSVLAGASGGTGSFTYTWSPSGGNAALASALTAGSYTVNITDANGCPLSGTVALTEPPALTLTISNTAATCGNNDGTATGTVTGGTGAYTYTWSPTGGNSATASSLAIGNYTLNVSDANGCVVTNTTAIANSGGATISVANTSVSCNGGTDGTATVTATGGMGSYTYTWSPAGGNAATASGLSAGAYTVSVTDGAGCVTIGTSTIAQPPALSATVTVNAVSCFGGTNGSASVSVSGGMGAYTYSWTPAGGAGSSAAGLSTGTYSVTITDGNSCTITSVAAITEPAQLSVSTVTTGVTCNGGNDGSATASASGGTGAYTYSWSPVSSSTANAANLAAGSYTVLVTDANTCTATATSIISEPAAITVTMSSTAATCGNNNGSATATVAGGTGSYTYNWQPGAQTLLTASALAPGNYTVTVTDSSGCTASDTVNVVNGGTYSVTITSTSVTCNAGSDGTASAAISGGVSPYTYAWSGGGSSASASNLAAGVHTLTVTDAASCVQTATVSISEPSAVSVTATSTIICNGQTGAVSASASGGTAPYQYSLNGSAPQTSNSFTVSPTATSIYSVTAVDDNGCLAPAAVATVTVLDPLQVSAAGGVICPGASASLQAAASGGNGNYTYTWMPGSMTGSVVSVSPQWGTVYTVTVSDGCTTVNASDTAAVVVSAVPTATLPAATSGCAPQCVNFSVPGDPSVVGWTWSFGDGASAAGESASHCYTSEGIYDVTLTYTTSAGCVNAVSGAGLVNIYAQPDAAFSASAYQVSVYEPEIQFYDQSTGQVTAWSWQFGDGSVSSVTHPSHVYADAGTYLVGLTVSNQYGCSDSAYVQIEILEDFTFYAPNAFTPDGDGKNEMFLPLGVGWDNDSYTLYIFDRWGNQVFTSSDPASGWDGTRFGENVQQDTYVWKVELKDIYGRDRPYKGVVSLIR